MRLRARTTRMGIDPATADHVVDAVDQRIEAAVARVEQLITLAEEPSQPLAPAAQAALVEQLQGATEEIEPAVERVDTIAVPAEEMAATNDARGGTTAGRSESGVATGRAVRGAGRRDRRGAC